MEPGKVAACVFAGVVAGTVIARGAGKRRYEPPAVWKAPQPESETGNRSTAGARTEKELPVGEHALQLYSLGTPNGVKVTILLEELCELNPDFDYDAWKIGLRGDQFTSGFVAVNPNSKIPALVDRTDPENPINVFESVAILMHLAENIPEAAQFLPTEKAARAKCLSWMFWQVGSAPYLGGGFGHFYHYYKQKLEYPINRFAMESKRQLAVLDNQLAKTRYIAGDSYTLADMAIWPWYGNLVLGRIYNAKEFLQVHEYPNVLRWANEVGERAAVKRGRMVNRAWGPEKSQVVNRHSRQDFEGKEI